MTPTDAEIASVKQLLPQVKIKYAGKEYCGRVTERLNQFATVTPVITPENYGSKAGPSFEFS